MSEIGERELLSMNVEGLVGADYVDGVGDDGASDSEAQAFVEMLQGETGELSDPDFQEQFDSNFQTFSYLFMKSVYSYVEEEIKRP